MWALWQEELLSDGVVSPARLGLPAWGPNRCGRDLRAFALGRCALLTDGLAPRHLSLPCASREFLE